MRVLALALLCCLLRAGSAALLAPAGTRLGEEDGGGGQGRPPWDGSSREKEAAVAALRVGVLARTYTRDPGYTEDPAAAALAAGSAGGGGWRGAALPLLRG